MRDPERVAGHMFRMGSIAMLLEGATGTQDCDKILDGSAVIVSILHDVAECIVGDITPHDKVCSSFKDVTNNLRSLGLFFKVTPEEKHEKEMKAMRSLVEKLPSPLARELFNAFERYETQREGDFGAKLTKDLDKFDMILQAFEYERAERKRKDFLGQFFSSTKDVFKTEQVKILVKHLLGLRTEMHSGENET